MGGNCISKSANELDKAIRPVESPGVGQSQTKIKGTKPSAESDDSCRIISHCSLKSYIHNTWISRESPEGGCVIINDTSSQTRLLEEILQQKRTVTSYEGYLVNEEDNLDPVDWDVGKGKSEDDFPIEIVELPAEPDGKHIDIHFVKEGCYDDEATQTPSLKPEDIDCGVSVRSMNSDRQQWSFSLYNFEDNGRISKEDLTNLVRSIYDALGKSMDKANKKSSQDQVKKVKVHISFSKEKQGKEMRGTAIVPRREVAVGAEDETTETEKQLEHLKLKEVHGESVKKQRKRKEREEKYSTVQVLNNDLGRAHLHSGRCKTCWPAEDKPSGGQSFKNNNLLADKPNFPTRRHTEPGAVTDTHMTVLNQELSQLTDRKSRFRPQRRSLRQKPCSGHASPDGHLSGHSSPLVQVPGRASPGGRIVGRKSPVMQVSGYASPGGYIAGHLSPVAGTPRKEVPLDPSYAYHADDNKYVYVHATPRRSPFEEPKSGRRRRSKQRRARDGRENPEEMPVKIAGTATSIVHRHEHVHHHYHHYSDKR